MYLLDTNVISATRRQTQHNSNVFKWLRTINERDLYTNAVVMMELERGVMAMERKDVQQGRILRIWLDETVKPTFSGKILKVDEHTATICAKLHIPDHAPENDAWIASSAIQHNLILVTRNVADFARTGVKLFNPFEFQS